MFYNMWFECLCFSFLRENCLKLLFWWAGFFDRYASIRAIETKSPVDDQQWLTYWVLYSMITLFELTFAKVIEW